MKRLLKILSIITLSLSLSGCPSDPDPWANVPMAKNQAEANQYALWAGCQQPDGGGCMNPAEDVNPNAPGGCVWLKWVNLNDWVLLPEGVGSIQKEYSMEGQASRGGGFTPAVRVVVNQEIDPTCARDPWCGDAIMNYYGVFAQATQRGYFCGWGCCYTIH